MYIDIIIFAAVAVFLILRLNSVLGNRNGTERERPNPFTDDAQGAAQTRAATDTAQNVLPLVRPLAPLAGLEGVVDETANAGGKIEDGLRDIAQADAQFHVHGFMQGARAAFEMVVLAYTKGDIETLRPLLSPKLFKDFENGIVQRNAVGHVSETIIHRIKQAKIVEAHLGGTMAYITVDYDVEETTVTRDSSGQVVDGDPDRIFSVEDIWTFTRDTRASDPNWLLIETRAVEK